MKTIILAIALVPALAFAEVGSVKGPLGEVPVIYKYKQLKADDLSLMSRKDLEKRLLALDAECRKQTEAAAVADSMCKSYRGAYQKAIDESAALEQCLMQTLDRYGVTVKAAPKRVRDRYKTWRKYETYRKDGWDPKQVPEGEREDYEMHLKVHKENR